MYSPFKLAYKYLKYYFTAANGKGHGIHSPFVFDFIKNVLNDKIVYPEFEKIENLRRNLMSDKTIITVEDLGAGEYRNKNRSVSSIARRSLKPIKFGQLFYRMVKKYRPQSILELGTSLGITTSYLSMAKPDARIITLEGSDKVADKARNNFSQLELKNIELVRGNFDTTLEHVLAQLHKIDFVFIDGNHRQEPTIRYYRQLFPKMHNDSILILDDIHWSREMEQAWKVIISDDAVACSMDLFSIGVILFRNQFKEKQHFIIRF